ncbi:membrane protein [Bacillus coahuilensis m2-6]|uniref:Membrane protein n=1 Tax=Bacillus coahuilensis p1.1.43 TaxID=1150625 RepID=A0A147K8E7_9BACI|nr:Bax inhibitor-1/YccA family protein [Bacillus coahuilensis]KUP06428.1 membrane protein [Bacillus coahuilensis p1.1.43]KUP08150.1 membrane protein [Bacillus coahuilensis m2-6]
MIETVYKQENALPAVLRAFAISLAFALFGLIAGVFVPPALILPLVMVEIGMLLFAFFLRRRKSISYTFLFTFTFISGITTYPVISYYLVSMGANLVLAAVGTTFIVFTGLAIYATTTKRDFSFLGGFLMAALLALISIGLFNFFFPLSSGGMLAYSFIGVLVFSGFVLYDFNRMKQMGVSPEEVPTMALNLYLDILNLFLSILRIFGILSSND